MLTRQLRLLGSALVLSLILPSATALADPFGSLDTTVGTGPKADSFRHTYCFGVGFDANLQDNASYAMQTSLDAATDMEDLYLATCGATTTDVFFLDANLPPGWRGSYGCVVWVSAPTVCDSADVTLDPAEINVGSNDEEDTTKSACHEVGHSVGLTHHDSPYDDCMLKGEIPNTNVQYRSYSAHHVGHINAAY